MTTINLDNFFHFDEENKRFTLTESFFTFVVERRKRKYEAPVQAKVMDEIKDLQGKITQYTKIAIATKNIPEFEDSYKKAISNLTEAEEELKTAQHKLINLQKAVENMRRSREKKLLNEKVGRPRLYVDLHMTVLSVVENLCAQDRRRDELCYTSTPKATIYRRVKEQVPGISYSTVCRTLKAPHRNRKAAKYYNSLSNIAFCKPTKTLGSFYDDDLHFTLASFSIIKELAIMFPQYFFIVGQDEKAKIPLFGAAVSNQIKGVHIDGKVAELPDHDFDSSGRKLIVNVVCSVGIDTNLHHHFTNASCYLRDEGLDKESIMNDLHDFVEKYSQKKPILVIQSDKYADVGPNNRKVQLRDTILFVIFGLDMLIHHSNTSNASRYNFTEMVMAPLSKALGGVVNIGETGKKDIICEQHENDVAVLGLFNLQKIFNGVQFGSLVTSIICNDDTSWNSVVPWQEIEDFFDNKKSTLEDEAAARLVKFCHSHSTEGNGSDLFVLKKCDDPTCCPPFKSKEVAAYLKKFDGWIPFPRPSKINAGHYMKLQEMMDDPYAEVDVEIYHPKPSVISYCEECGRAIYSKTDKATHKATHNMLFEEDIEDQDLNGNYITTVKSVGDKSVSLCRLIRSFVDGNDEFGVGKRVNKIGKYK